MKRILAVLSKSSRGRSSFFLLLSCHIALLATALPARGQLTEHCTVSILNRTVQVKPDGTWVLPNVPASFGKVRARATCVDGGITRTGQTDSFLIPPNGSVTVSEISLGAVDPIPAALRLTAPTATLASPGETTQLTVTATLPDSSTRDVTAASAGTSYTMSNRAVATVSADGLVTAVAGGAVIISALNEGALGLIRLQVANTGSDSDGDGIPDDVETANGLNPNDPTDATFDPDGDGLTNKQELIDYSTNPQLADTDGDGVRDGLEIQTGSNPLDPGSLNLAQALSAIAVLPVSSVLVLNTILGEAAQQLTVLGQLRDGQTVDLTATARGTNYTSSDLSICNFSPISGLVFAGAEGTCTVTATNSGFSAQATLTIRPFAPIALAALPIPGYANNVDVNGSLAYVAAGAAGLQVVDATDPLHPHIVGALDTPGNANDVRVVGSLAFIADGAAGLQIVNIADPTQPIAVGALDTPGDAQDVRVAGTRAYVADGVAGLRIIDVSEPATPRFLGAVDTPGTARGVDIVGNFALVADDVPSSAVRVIDVSNPVTPQMVGQVTIMGNPKDIVARGTVAYVAAFLDGLQVVEFSSPANPQVVGSVPLNLVTRDVELVGSFALSAEHLPGVSLPILDITTPAVPVLRALLDFSSLGNYFGTGLALTPQQVFMTGDSFFASADNRATGDTHLLIGQYAELEDKAEIPPTVLVTDPPAGTSVREGTLLFVTVEASDDLAVAAVTLLANGVAVGTDTTAPYQFTLTVPASSASLSVSAVATDFGNTTTEAPIVSVTVVPGTP